MAYPLEPAWSPDATARLPMAPSPNLPTGPIGRGLPAYDDDPDGVLAEAASVLSAAEVMPVRQRRGLRPADIAAAIGSLGGNGFARGYFRMQQMQASRDAQDLQRAMEARRLRLEDEDRTLRAQDREETRTRRQRDDRTQFFNTLRTHMADAETPQEFALTLGWGRRIAPSFGVDATEIDGLFSPSRQRRQLARTRLEQLQKTYSAADVAGLEDGAIFDFGADGERVTLAQLRELAGVGARTPQGQPFPVGQRPASGDFGAHVEDVLAAENDTRRAAGKPPLSRRERADLRIRERERWNEAGRASGPSAGEQRTDRREQERTLRAELRDAIEHPAAQKPGTMKRLASSFAKTGVDFDRAIRETKALITRDKAADLQRRTNIENAMPGETLPTVEDIGREFDAALARETGAPAPGVGAPAASAGPVATPAGPNGQRVRTATRAEVQAVAQRTGVSYDEAKRQLEARGVVVQ